ncbi:MAG TPA: ATP-dependent DNA helicase [Candidatus Aenigmarchaeota archaeon]|nr:ATP-dependent DNA helicase [Candidatus Aenigmarchaeota archaeon]
MNLSKFLFPFPKVRPVQKDMIKKVYEVVSNSNHLIAHAPTGIGKTAAVLSPSLAYALNNDLTVFFLTPKHSQHKIVVETLQRIKEKYDVEFTSIDIIGKKWLCNVPGVEDLSSKDFIQLCKTLKKDERCEYYNNTISRMGKLRVEAEKVLERIRKAGPIHVEEAKKYCGELCVYEILTRLGKEADVIVCDYFHLFHPMVSSTFLNKTSKSLGDSIIIIDEGHNLPNRVKELLSEKLTEIMLERARKEAVKFEFKEEAKDIDNLSKKLRRYARKKLSEAREAYVSKNDLVSLVKKSVGLRVKDFILEMEQVADVVREEKLRSYCGGIARFFEAWNESDERFARIVNFKNGNFVFDLHCLDPSIVTADVIASSHSTIIMSGTLTPTFMYRDILGFEEERTEMVEYPSVFPKENRLNLIVPGLTTKYSKREESEYKRYARYITEIVNASPPNVAVFFPSYEVMNEIIKFVGDLNKEKFVEKRGMSKEKKTLMLKRFEDALKKRGAVLFGVMGASFAEGVDYKNNLLKCVIVAGLALEKPDLKMQSLINYYQQKFGRGWAYGYLYPAVARAIQAAGRCIRSASDRGVIVFLEERFLWRNYLRGFPKDFEFKVTKEPKVWIEKFWKKG